MVKTKNESYVGSTYTTSGSSLTAVGWIPKGTKARVIQVKDEKFWVEFDLLSWSFLMAGNTVDGDHCEEVGFIHPGKIKVKWTGKVPELAATVGEPFIVKTILILDSTEVLPELAK